MANSSARLTFINNFTEAMTSKPTKAGQRLKPIGESAPSMWSVTTGWSPLPEGVPALLRPTPTTYHPVVTQAETIVDLEKRKALIRGALMSLIILTGATTSDANVMAQINTKVVTEWCSLICTVAQQVFEDPLANPNLGAESKRLSIQATNNLRTLYCLLAIVSTEPANVAALTELNTLIGLISVELKLPRCGQVTQHQADLASRIDGNSEQAAYYAIIVYLAGRSMTTQATAAIHEKRPRNLQEKFNGGAPWHSLSGDIKMSVGAYTLMAKVWQMNTTMRMNLLIPLIYLEAGLSMVTGNIVYTVFKLLKNAGFAHVQFILAFLRQYPFVEEMEDFRGEIQYLAAHALALSKVDAAIRPYYKVLYSDGAGLFDSKTLEKLTGLAVSVLAETTVTINNYRHVTDPNVRARFDSRLETQRRIDARALGRRLAPPQQPNDDAVPDDDSEPPEYD
jgi:hypothetical protein